MLLQLQPQLHPTCSFNSMPLIPQVLLLWELCWQLEPEAHLDPTHLPLPLPLILALARALLQDQVQGRLQALLPHPLLTSGMQRTVLLPAGPSQRHHLRRCCRRSTAFLRLRLFSLELQLAAAQL